MDNAYYTTIFFIFPSFTSNAVWHKAKVFRISQYIESLFIPPYCPEMNPIEQIWNTIR
ncbi:MULTISPECIES: transposase [Streptococcus]|uniref:transposase n=1 Tax=Streptococcus TaxID=1301 RepID=UPI00107173A2|nr:hypothetical protein E4T83_04950 [Streptococcus sp. AN2]